VTGGGATDEAPAPGPRETGPPPPTPLRRALAIGFRVLGVALLAAVLWKVPWRDRVHLVDGTVLTGRLAGDWHPGASVVLEEGTEIVEVPAASLAVRERGMPAVEEGVLRLSTRFRAGPAIAVILIAGVSVAVAALRWRMLVRAQGVPLPVKEAGALTLLGNFFNQVVPGGLVGGDVLKAIYAARGGGGTAPALVSVFTDRALGLFGMIVLACAALAPRWDDPRFHGHAVLAYGILAAGIVGSALVFSRRLRTRLQLERRAAAVPGIGSFLAEADQAVVAFRERKGVLAIGLVVSVAIHCGWCGVNAILGSMLGVDLPVSAWFAVVPPILVVSVVPLLPGGWGLGEASYVFFLGLVGVPPAEAVAVSILGRSINMLWALPGGFVFLSRRG
jgi:uncharacterized protein (TIRG00374 family)